MATDNIDSMQANSLNCSDFLAFQEQLIRARKIDDNIVHMLNASLPSESFSINGSASKARADAKEPAEQCRTLWNLLLSTHQQRQAEIERCIQSQGDHVRSLKKKREINDSHQINKQLKQEQRKLRLLQSELNVEEVVRDRSSKIFQERCRRFYLP